MDRRERKIRIEKSTPLFRLTVLPRRSFIASGMSDVAFDRFFSAGQKWLAAHARDVVDGTADIRGAYVTSQRLAEFRTT